MGENGKPDARGSNNPNFKHGRVNTRTYRIWAGMLSRCNNPNREQYKKYGARGIKVCKEWHDFRNFLRDMGECPDGMQIDRIDYDGNYTRENCRWVCLYKQAQNKRNVKLYAHKGQKLCLKEIARMENVPYKRLYARVTYHGWDLERAIKAPATRGRPKNAAKK